MTQAKLLAAQQEEAGGDIAAFELAARTVLANGAFEESEEEISVLVEELYPDAISEQRNDDGNETPRAQAKTGSVSTTSKLSKKLVAKANRD